MGTDPTLIYILALVVWREAQNQSTAGRLGVAFSVLNRLARPGWWGKSLVQIITKPFQYSSFNHNDPGVSKWPEPADVAWQECYSLAADVLAGKQADPTGGATFYFDRSMDANPPTWASQYTHTADIGDFHFYTDKD